MREEYDSIFDYAPKATITTANIHPTEEIEPEEEKEMEEKKKPSRTELIVQEDGSKYRSFKFGRCPHEPGLQVYKKGTHSFKPGISILVGCNGSGIFKIFSTKMIFLCLNIVILQRVEILLENLRYSMVI